MNKPLLALGIGGIITGAAMMIKGIYDFGWGKGRDDAYIDITAMLEGKLDDILGNRKHLEDDNPTDGVHDYFEKEVTEEEFKASKVGMYTISTNDEEVTFPYIELTNSNGTNGYLLPFRKYRFQVCGNLGGQIDLGSSPNVAFDDMHPEDRHKWKNAAFSQAMYAAGRFMGRSPGWDIENTVWDLVDATYEMYYSDVPEDTTVDVEI